jgi:hypothetical protein
MELSPPEGQPVFWVVMARPLLVSRRLVGLIGLRFSEQDLGSLGGCDAGPAFFLIFGRHRYVFIWDYLVLIGLIMYLFGVKL